MSLTALRLSRIAWMSGVIQQFSGRTCRALRGSSFIKRILYLEPLINNSLTNRDATRDTREKSILWRVSNHPKNPISIYPIFPTRTITRKTSRRLINSSYQRGRNWTNYVKRHDLCISSDNFPSLERKKKERFTERRIGNKKGRRTDSRHERIPVHVGGKLIRYPWHRQYNQRIYPVWKTSSVQRAYLCATAKGLTRCPRPSRTRL